MKQSGLLDLFHKKIGHAESEHTPLINYFITFIACLLLRDFLEAFTLTSRNFLNADALSVLITVAHFNAFYLGIALSLAIAIHYMTQTPMTRVLRILLPCFILLCIAPLVDYFFPNSEVYGYTYFSTFENHSLIASYFSFYGQFSAATLGMRIEIFAGLIGVFLYVYDKTQSLWKALFGCWLAYSIIFFFASSQFVLKGLADLLGISYMPSGISFLFYFFILNLWLGTWVGYLANKHQFMNVCKDIPVLRVLNYEIMLLLGICLAFQADFSGLMSTIATNPMLLINGMFLMVAILFASLFAMAINNLEDIEIDKISNRERAVAAGKISEASYGKIAYACLFLASTYAAPVGTQAVFFVLLFMGNYYLYSASPLRMKRITVFSKLVISGNSFILFLLGYWVVRHHFSIFSNLDVSMKYVAILFALVTLAANFIDLKDLAGDKAAGIQTLPVVIGMRQAQYVCGMAFFLSYLAMALILPGGHFFLGCLIVGGAMQFYWLTRKTYHEQPILVFHIASLLFLIVFMFASQNTPSQTINVTHESVSEQQSVNPQITELIANYNHYFKTNYSTFEPIKQEALVRVNKFYTAVRNCTPGKYQYILQYMAGVVFYTSEIQGKQNGVCVVESSFIIPGKTEGTRTCQYQPASQLLFTDAQAEYDGSGKFELDNAHLTPFQQVEINDCRYVGKLLNKP